MIKIGIIIPVRNRWNSCTQPILNQLAQQGVINSENYCVVVVDDGSTDDTVAGIQKFFPTVTLLEGDGNLWWGGAIALGMQYLYDQDIQIIVWMNDDLTLSENFIEKLYWVSQQALNQQAIVGGIVLYRDDQSWIVFSGIIRGQIIRSFDQLSDLWTPVDSLHGNIVIFPKPVIDKLGLPHFKDFPHYGGDHAYTELARKQRIPIFICSDLIATTD